MSDQPIDGFKLVIFKFMAFPVQKSKNSAV